MKLSEYLEKAIFHTGKKCPVSKNKRVVYRTYTQLGGLKFISNVHLGIIADSITWSDIPHNKVYDWAEVKENPLILMAKTRKI